MTLPRLAKVHAPDTIDSSSSTSPPPSSLLIDNGQQQQQQQPPSPADGVVATTGNTATSGIFDTEKEEAAAEAELLDTLVGLVALKGGAGGAPPNGTGGLGAQGGSIGNGRYTVRLSEGRESSGKAELSTLLNLLFVPDGRCDVWRVKYVVCGVCRVVLDVRRVRCVACDVVLARVGKHLDVPLAFARLCREHSGDEFMAARLPSLFGLTCWSPAKALLAVTLDSSALRSR